MTNELHQYQNDRTGWLAYVSPSMARKIAEMRDKPLNDAWERMPQDYKRAVWQHLDEPSRERIRRVRA